MLHITRPYFCNSNYDPFSLGPTIFPFASMPFFLFTNSLFSLLTYLGSSEMKKSLTWLKVTPAADSTTCPYRLNTPLWCFLVDVSYLTQVSSIPKHTCGICQCYWNLLCSTPELTAWDCHLSYKGKIMWVLFSSISFPRTHFYLQCRVPDMTRSRLEELFYNYTACCEGNAYSPLERLALLHNAVLCFLNT